MRYIKRFLAALIALTMIIPGVSAADIYDVEDEKVLEAIEELSRFGIVEIYSDNSFRGYENVTRRDMAIYISKMLANEGGGSSNYRDVPIDDKGYDAIGFVTSKNIMIGNGEGRFRPDDYITCAEAVKTVVSALGFDSRAQGLGGYPNGYIQMASQLGLPVDFEMNEYITKSEIVMILHHAYYAPVYTMKIEDGRVVYTMDEDVTVLSYYNNIKKYRGIVTGTYLSKLNSADSGMTKEQIEIDGYVFDTSLDNTDEFLGCHVEYYLREEDDEAEVVSIREYDKNRQVSVLSYDILPSTNKLQLVADVNGKDKTYKISENADFIYNREAAPDFNGKGMIPENGLIRIIDNNNDNIFDVVFIENYETVVVEYVSASNMTIANKYNNSVGTSLDLSEDAGYDFVEYELDGTPAQFSDITAGDVLSVLKTKEKTSILVKINRTSVSGIISSYDDEYCNLTDGDSYRISQALEKAWLMGDISKPQPGADVNIYFDSFGNAAYAVSASGIEGYGFLRKVWYDESEEKSSFRILSIAAESWDTYKCSEKIKIDGVKPDEQSSIKAILGEKQLVRFKTNAEGEITKIETATVYENPGDKNEIIMDKFRATSKATLRYRTQNNSWNSQFYMDNDTKILYVPTSEMYANDESFYNFIDTSYFTPDRDYSIQGFEYDDEHFLKLVIHYGTAASAQNVSNSAYSTVCRIDDTLNNDDEVVKKLTCIVSGKEYEFYTTDNSNSVLEGIERGDILQLGFDEDGKISTVERIYDYSSGFATNTNAIGDYHAYRVIVKADVLEVGTRTIKIRTQARDYVFKRNGSVTICDMAHNEIRTGTFDDIEAGDFVVIRYGQSSLRDTVVYRR